MSSDLTPVVPGGSLLPPGIAGFSPYLGSHGMTHVLAEAGIGTCDRPLPGLPVPPRPGGRSYVERVRSALGEMLAAYPVGHLLVPADVVLLRAAADVALPTTVWLSAGSPSDTVAHFVAATGPNVDVTVAPELPRPRGTLPALVLLGDVAAVLCRVPPSGRSLVQLFTGGQMLGITVVIDPTDGGYDARLGWPSLWTQRFTAVLRPADDESDRILEESR